MKKHCDKSRNQLPELPDRNEIEKKIIRLDIAFIAQTEI